MVSAAEVLSVGKARCRSFSGMASAPSATTTRITAATGRRPTSRAQRTPLLRTLPCSSRWGRYLRTRPPKALDLVRPRMAGSSVSATRTATSTVAAAARPIAVRNGMPTTESAARAMRTVRPAKTTAEPAVPTETPTASSRSPVCSSSLR